MIVEKLSKLSKVFKLNAMDLLSKKFAQKQIKSSLVKKSKRKSKEIVMELAGFCVNNDLRQRGFLPSKLSSSRKIPPDHPTGILCLIKSYDISPLLYDHVYMRKFICVIMCNVCNNVLITLYVLNHPPSNIHAPYYENDNIVDNHHDHIDHD